MEIVRCEAYGSGMTPFDSPAGVAGLSVQTLLPDVTPEFVFSAPRTRVTALAGIDAAGLGALVEEAEHVPDDRRVLFLQLRPAASVEAYVEQVIALLAEAAMRLWPIWFTDVSFAVCRDDALGRQTVGLIAHEAAVRTHDVSAAWAGAATRLALAGCLPRVAGMPAAVELTQLSLAVNRAGLILVVDLGAAANAPSAPTLARALEWIAQNSRAAVIALVAELPPLDSPFARILYGARQVKPAGAEPIIREQGSSDIWLAPWRGAPHPLSELEQRLAAMLGQDDELAALFRFNWFVETVRGSRPKVDLVWTAGRLVVELDGYPDHTTRRAFIGDRQRDYELVF